MSRSNIISLQSAAPRTKRDATVSHLRAMEIRRGGRTPDAGMAGGPALGSLRGVVMPRARLEIAELLVLHLVELAEELDDLLIRIAMVGRDVVTGAMTQRSPDDRDLLLAHQLA